MWGKDRLSQSCPGQLWSFGCMSFGFVRQLGERGKCGIKPTMSTSVARNKLGSRTGNKPCPTVSLKIYIAVLYFSCRYSFNVLRTVCLTETLIISD